MATGSHYLQLHSSPSPCRASEPVLAARSPARSSINKPILHNRSVAQSAACSPGFSPQHQERRPAYAPFGRLSGALHSRRDQCRRLCAVSGEYNPEDDAASESAGEQPHAAGTQQGSPAAGPAADEGGSSRDGGDGNGGGGDGGVGPPLSGAEEAAQVVAECLDLFRECRLDELLSYVPDDVIDRCLQRRKQRALRGAAAADEEITFEDVLRQASKRDFYLDTFGMRALVFEPPRSIQVLSSMALGEGTFLQRCAVVTASGEAATITFRLVRAETLEPQYRGLRLVKRWVLASVTGESTVPEEGGEAELRRTPHPCLSPEAAVLAQLSGLKRLDVGAVFAFASPSNQAATGPVQRFGRMLQSPTYEPLLRHEDAVIVSTMQAVPRSAVVVVSVSPSLDGAWRGSGSGADGQRLVYLWFLSLQGPGPLEGCWCTDAVQLGAASADLQN